MILLLKRGEKAKESYLQAKKEYKRFRLYKKGAEEYWLINDDYFIGRIAYRKTKYSGEVVYDIRPRERGRGYGTKMLKLFLGEMKKKGRENLEIICKKENLASKNIIERNGGEIIQTEGEKMVYLIKLL